MTVDKARVRLLVDALRSGEFTQGHGYLNRRGKQCCLGVGCIIALRNDAEVSASQADEPNETVSYYDRTKFGRYEDLSDTHLPIVVRDWYGFDSHNPPLRLTREQFDTLVSSGRMSEFAINTFNSTLEAEGFVELDATDCNDDLHMTFAEIADAFERTYLTEETPE